MAGAAITDGVTITDTAEAAAAAPRRAGRPTREDASLLVGHIVATATELFLAEGYGATSIETVARRAGISKRTFYSRFTDKPALFRAVVHHVLDHLRPADHEALFQPGPLDRVLPPLARAILSAALDPWALALYRVTVAESARFPDIAATVATEGGGREAVERIAALLEARPGTHAPGEARFAAAQFLQMVVAVPQRRAIGHGPPMSPPELAYWVEATVRLFLRGWAGA